MLRSRFARLELLESFLFVSDISEQLSKKMTGRAQEKKTLIRNLHAPIKIHGSRHIATKIYAFVQIFNI